LEFLRYGTEQVESQEEAVAEESVLMTQRDEDKTPVMELLQRLSDSDVPESQEPPALHMRMSRTHTLFSLTRVN